MPMTARDPIALPAGPWRSPSSRRRMRRCRGGGALLLMKDAPTVRVGHGGIDIGGFPQYASGFYPIGPDPLGDYSVGDGYVTGQFPAGTATHSRGNGADQALAGRARRI